MSAWDLDHSIPVTWPPWAWKKRTPRGLPWNVHDAPSAGCQQQRPRAGGVFWVLCLRTRERARGPAAPRSWSPSVSRFSTPPLVIAELFSLDRKIWDSSSSCRDAWAVGVTARHTRGPGHGHALPSPVKAELLQRGPPNGGSPAGSGGSTLRQETLRAGPWQRVRKPTPSPAKRRDRCSSSGVTRTRFLLSPHPQGLCR